MERLIKFIILLLLEISWAFVFIYTYEYFTRAVYNRLRFRYWLVVSFFNMIHVLLAFFFVFMNVPEIQRLRLLIFLIINLNMFEVFMYTAHNIIDRKTEAKLRIVFPLINIVSSITLYVPFILISNAILIYLAYICKNKHFIISFSLYLSIFIVVHFFGFITIPSLITGFLYSIHVMIGIRKMYKEEHIEEQIKKEGEM